MKDPQTIAREAVYQIIREHDIRNLEPLNQLDGETFAELFAEWVKITERALEAAVGEMRGKSFVDLFIEYNESQAELTELRAQVAKYEARLCIDPGGGDEIDALNSALNILRDQLEQARKGVEENAA